MLRCYNLANAKIIPGQLCNYLEMVKQVYYVSLLHVIYTCTPLDEVHETLGDAAERHRFE